jgi:hypothetical protein
VRLSATLEVGEETFEVVIENLSLGGAYFTGHKLPMGHQVAIQFRLPTHDDPIRSPGQVRWSTDVGIGIQFAGLRAREVWALNKYFEQLPSEE